MSETIEPRPGERIKLEAIEEPPDFTPEATRFTEVDGIPFRLGDGREWFLATPTARLRPRIVDGQAVGIESRFGYPMGVQEKVDSLSEMIYGESRVIPFEGIFDAALALLRRCHNLTVEQALGLLEMSPEEAESLILGMVRMFRGHGQNPEELENASKGS